jgi:hypothetical protein
MSHMFSTEVTALLRRILDDVCADVSIGGGGSLCPRGGVRNLTPAVALLSY